MLDWDYYGQYGNIIDVGMRSKQVAAPGIESEVQPGRWLVQLQLETGDLDPEAVPVELGIQVLDPNEKAGQATEPGEAATPAPSATADAQREPGGGRRRRRRLRLRRSSSRGVAGLLIGAAGGFLAVRGRRSHEARAPALPRARPCGAGRRDGADAGHGRGGRRLVRRCAAARVRQLPRHDPSRRAAVLRRPARARAAAARSREGRRQARRGRPGHRGRLLDRAPDAAARGDRRHRRGHRRQQHGRRGRRRARGRVPARARRLRRPQRDRQLPRPGRLVPVAVSDLHRAQAGRRSSSPSSSSSRWSATRSPTPRPSRRPPRRRRRPSRRATEAVAARRRGAIAGIGLAGLLVGLVGGGLAARRG